jgi:hypothetical protein
MIIRAAAFALLLLSAGIASAQTAPAFTPGQWQVDRTRSGGPGGAGTVREQICVTAEALKADPALLLRPPKSEPGQSKSAAPDCAMSNVQMANGKVNYTATCKGPMGTLKLPWQGAYSSTGFDISAKARMGLMSLSMRQVGRRLGACEAARP